MLGMKFYPTISMQILMALVHEYGVIEQAQLRGLLAGREIESSNIESLLLKLRRNAQLSQFFDEDDLIVFSSDCARSAKKVKALKKIIWVLWEYIQEVDYHFCCSDIKNQIAPCICFGNTDKHYELFYLPKGDEDFFNISIEAFERELLYKISMNEGEDSKVYKYTVLSTRRLVVLDDFDQIEKLKINRVVAYCTVDTDNSGHKIIYKMMEE